MNSDFAKTIQELRRGRKLSQRRAAAELGISQALLSHYENGARQPKLTSVRKIARFYGVTADELLGHPARERNMPECEARLIGDVTETIEYVESVFGETTASLAARYLAAAVRNVRAITEDPNCPYDPRVHLDIREAEAALYDAARNAEGGEKNGDEVVIAAAAEKTPGGKRGGGAAE
ncbi:MAG: helix-turn-helix domain-containing protein [Oscillospiraceae bacterium]|jgi:transcriptional regulator with XRE-family HTH domain|nr:helix-turn-helix domain-containing protein [Oscillospiraceae bacterium]